MSLALLTALQQEQEIFQKFSSFCEMDSGSRLFYSRDTNSVPHWNLVYPKNLPYHYSSDEINFASRFYSERKLVGHLLYSDQDWAGKANEISEYFVLESGERSALDFKLSENFKILSELDLDYFVSIVSRVFNLDSAARKLFLEKMNSFSQEEGSRFFVVGMNGKPCGTLSAFRCSNNTSFLFNMAILPEFQKMGIGSDLMKYATSQCKERLLINSHNFGMRSHILPKAGFKSVGTAYLVPIHDSDYLVESLYRG